MNEKHLNVLKQRGLQSELNLGRGYLQTSLLIILNIISSKDLLIILTEDCLKKNKQNR